MATDYNPMDSKSFVLLNVGVVFCHAVLLIIALFHGDEPLDH